MGHYHSLESENRYISFIMSHSYKNRRNEENSFEATSSYSQKVNSRSKNFVQSITIINNNPDVSLVTSDIYPKKDIQFGGAKEKSTQVIFPLDFDVKISRQRQGIRKI